MLQGGRASQLARPAAQETNELETTDDLCARPDFKCRWLSPGPVIPQTSPGLLLSFIPNRIFSQIENLYCVLISNLVS